MEKVEITSEQIAKWKDQLCDLYFEGNMTIKFDDLAWGFQKMFEKEDKPAKKKAGKGKKKKDYLKGKWSQERGDRVMVINNL